MRVLKLKYNKEEENTAIFRTEDNEEVKIPFKYIPFEVREGSTLYIKIQKKITGDQENQKDLAKAVLEEILNGGE